MASKRITSKVIINKKTGQLMIFPSKKKIRAAQPTLKFGEDLFVKLEFIRRKK